MATSCPQRNPLTPYSTARLQVRSGGLQVNNIDRQSVHDALRELSDRELQRRLWLSDGSGDSEVSSFAEAVEQLFTDTGLADSLHAGGTGLGAEADAALGELKMAVRKVGARHGPLQTIDDPAMAKVRTIASRLLGLLASLR